MWAMANQGEDMKVSSSIPPRANDAHLNMPPIFSPTLYRGTHVASSSTSITMGTKSFTNREIRLKKNLIIL
jgi:hypothetical protein